MAGAPKKTMYPQIAREQSSMTTVSHGRAGLPSVPTSTMSSRVWSACHIALGRSAARRTASSYLSR